MAPQPQHTYGSKCRLAPIQRSPRDDGVPPISAQYFYSSLIPIDDPLSTTAGSISPQPTSSRALLRPFGRGDNNALEKAWLDLPSVDDRRNHTHIRLSRVQTDEAAGIAKQRAVTLVQKLVDQHFDKHGAGFQAQDIALPSAHAGPIAPIPVCCTRLMLDISQQLQASFCSFERAVSPSVNLEHIVTEVMAKLTLLQQTARASEPQSATPDSAFRPRSRADSSSQLLEDVQARLPKSITGLSKDTVHRKGSLDRVAQHIARPRSSSQATNTSSRTQISVGSMPQGRAGGLDHGLTGRPFVRVGTLEQPDRVQSSLPNLTTMSSSTDAEAVADSAPESPPMRENRVTELPKDFALAKKSAEVAVGVSRLHMVSLPELKMKPIYWSPVNDAAVVTRATWFYRDTMLPVSSAVANQLEAGFQELRPWTETWSDEIRCAIEIGPAGEEKVSHRLWPKDNAYPKGQKGPLEPRISSDPYCAARCFHGDAAAEGSVEIKTRDTEDAMQRPFSNYHVIYKNESEAFMLKPSLKPSAYYGRRPIQKLSKGLTVGIPVVRGFDRERWEQISHKKQTAKKETAPVSEEPRESNPQDVCRACKADKDRGQATDLILVAHGIGQKFAERVESFHFTHAINGFRRAVNIELGNPQVRQLLREDNNGLMILPLNWRSGLSFEDGGPIQEDEKGEEHTPEGFGLKDIEPDTIPAIRSMISDVMFDLPYYMSHHKSKMIQALVSEANRVYRLWCHNNPGFATHGRVHLIGHSLGSAMALEILSRQPTTVPKIDLTSDLPETRFFEFDTRNLFLAGSPAGFFLLLERGALVPRRGRVKPGADPADYAARKVTAEAGTFGCLAVDNIYNILAKEDPIAYLLNGAIDPSYSATLKKAYVPSLSSSMFASIGSAMRSAIPGLRPLPDPLAPDAERPSAIRLPSQLELEVHDFTREEIAEKKAYLLNDNGQVDWFLRGSGGPLEIQYLNMLSAHTSYWTNQDFVRMICIEIGREPGRAKTLPAFRAVKVNQFAR